ncbi:hypothetical protein FXW36_13210 [Rhodococcus opacus]|uniref:hypothetical protein n=1 Tax=Rhodococcus opacus TaxID=37919 RepID=UPI001C9E04FF|nr:hypothetical protein [Rhodococcus opacus]QZS57896.1 hypothetical protein FXW36_13210 [Rhodococcus opacus]
MKVGSRLAAVAVFAASIGLGTSGVAWGDALDSAVVPVRAPDTVAPLPPGVPPTGPAGCDDWAEPYENNVPAWGTDPYNQSDNWCDGPEDGLPQPATYSGDEGGGDSPNEP